MHFRYIYHKNHKNYTDSSVIIDIYLFNSVDCDANCDTAMNMSDAILIMQSIANPAKYKLTSQGNFNADTDGDGITNSDALSIQKKLLHLE